MRRPHATSLFASLMLAACASDEPQVLVPDSVEVPWDAAWNDRADGLVALVPLDAMLYDPVTGAPIVGVPVRFSSPATLDDGSAGAAVTFIDPGQVRATDPLRDAGDTDVPCEACVWDAWSDTLLDLGGGLAEAPVDVTTDAHGLARVFVLVDAFDATDVGAAVFVTPLVVDGADGADGADPRVGRVGRARAVLLQPR